MIKIKKFLKEESVKLVVMINGKKRGLIEAPLNVTQEFIIKIISSEKKIPVINAEKFKKIIFVKNKIINFVQ